MKFQMHRSDFVLLISKIQGIVPSKPALPILANILIEASDNQITLSATDLIVSMRVFATANVIEEGAITLPAKRLFQLTRELTALDLEIDTPSPEVANVKAGSSEFRIQGMHKSEYPAFPDLSQGVDMPFKAEVLKEMLMRTSFAAARDDSRQVLNGVLMQRASSLATFTGTDGKRLARNQVEIETEDEGSTAGSEG